MMSKNSGNDPFSVQAGFYKKYRPIYPSKLYEFIFQHLDRYQHAWDCGTGSGQVAGYLADHFEKVFASDISRDQLNHAIQKENIRYINKPGEDSGYPAGFFDLIAVAQAVHWFDFDRFYKEVERTGRHHALIAVFGYGRIQTSGNLQPYVEKLYDKVFSEYYSSNRRYIEEHYRNIPFPFKEIPTPLFEYHTRLTIDELEGYFNTWSATQKYKAEYGENPVNPVIHQIRNKSNIDSKLHVWFPMFLRLGYVHSS